MNWRRLGGAVLMSLGGLVMFAMCVVAAVVIANYVEWENAADALGTVAMIAAVPIGAGLVVTLIGRAVYGGWGSHAPLRGVSSFVLRMVGFTIALTLAGLLALVITAGVGPEDREMAVLLCAGVMMGVGVAFLGFLVKPRHAAD